MRERIAKKREIPLSRFFAFFPNYPISATDSGISGHRESFTKSPIGDSIKKSENRKLQLEIPSKSPKVEISNRSFRQKVPKSKSPVGDSVKKFKN
jgi:hypothetical protein